MLEYKKKKSFCGISDGITNLAAMLAGKCSQKQIGMKRPSAEFYCNPEEGVPRTLVKYTRDDVSCLYVTGFVMTWREKPPFPGDVTSRVLYLTEFF
jgi:hypothetical protein